MLFNPLQIGAGKIIAVGVAAAVLAPLALPVVARSARPLARAAVKTGIVVYEKGRETLAEAGETFDDLVAEARAELEQEGRFQPDTINQDSPGSENA
jgi:hypothetical protein